ncbi:hypothetical protein FPRO03_05135 [Fusarium proliferatum]|nr:hypothetical protein FPRO03_05135 [Fusarium proliferatum]
MQSAHESNNSIIVEESSALMLDVTYSSYPFITLSDTTLGSIISGLTFNSKNITKTIGVYIEKFVGPKITWHVPYNTKAFTNMHRMKWISTGPGCETTIKDT